MEEGYDGEGGGGREGGEGGGGRGMIKEVEREGMGEVVKGDGGELWVR